MELMENREMITSRDLLKKINELRELEYNHKIENGLELGKVEKRNGKYTELRHDTLLNVIRDEFSEEINRLKIEPVENEKSDAQKILAVKSNKQNIYLSKYIDEKGEKRDMYVLPLEKAKQVLMRESKFVRKAVIEYIDYLENQNRQLEELARLQARELSKVTRNIETLSLKALMEYGKVRKERQRIYYIHYSNLARDIAGIPKGIKRDKLTQGQLGILQQVELIMTSVINECMGENIPFVLMYQEVKDRTEIKAKVLLKALQRVENVDNGPVWKLEY